MWFNGHCLSLLLMLQVFGVIEIGRPAFVSFCSQQPIAYLAWHCPLGIALLEQFKWQSSWVSAAMCATCAFLWLGLPPNETTLVEHCHTLLMQSTGERQRLLLREACPAPCPPRQARHAPGRSDRDARGRFSHKTGDKTTARETSTFGNGC